MKKIVELCARDRDGKFIPDAVKLRLRGRGSGYKEGPYNRGKKSKIFENKKIIFKIFSFRI
jgi:hypothetical protein